MKTRRLRNKKSYKSKRISKKAKVHHKKSKRHIKKRRNITRKRGGKEFNPYRREHLEYANPVMMIDTNIPPQPDRAIAIAPPVSPPGSPDIRNAMDVLTMDQEDSIVEENSPRLRLFSETDDEEDSEAPSRQRMRL